MFLLVSGWYLIFPNVASAQMPFGWYGLTPGPPISVLMSPDMASAWSRSIHDGMRYLGACV